MDIPVDYTYINAVNGQKKSVYNSHAEYSVD